MKLTGMTFSFDSFERKLDQLIGTCARLRTDNQTLQARIADLEAEKSALENKIDVTRTRLEALMARLPEE
jgi:uncharacterized protein (TIGR02449 family)